MKVLFVVSTIFINEPLGALLLLSIVRREGYQVRLADLSRCDFNNEVQEFEPDVVAYSVMSADIEHFVRADNIVKVIMQRFDKKIFRIMGGPHPTFEPGVIDELKLDAICQGDGDNALVEILRKKEKGEPLDEIPNIALTAKGAKRKELFSGLETLPYIERDEEYRIAPQYESTGLRSFIAGRGCPYTCTYCFNDAFNREFRSCGPILRRMAVDHLLNDIEYTIEKYPPVRFIRFADDGFVYKADEWFREFAEKYPKRIGIPFYCMVRPDNMSEEVAQLLSKAGCISVSMSVETGIEKFRRDIMKRNISDEVLKRSYILARKHGIATYGNTILGLPGTTLEDDFASLEFVRKLPITSPSFTICIPFVGTTLWKMSVERGVLANDAKDLNRNFWDLSPFNNLGLEEKRTQLRMKNLGALYCCAPGFLAPVIKGLINSNISLRLSRRIGGTYEQYRRATRIFPHAIPRTPKTFLRIIMDIFNNIQKPVKNSQ